MYHLRGSESSAISGNPTTCDPHPVSIHAYFFHSKVPFLRSPTPRSIAPANLHIPSPSSTHRSVDITTDGDGVKTLILFPSFHP